MRLHHIGVVVADIEQHGRLYAENLGIVPLTEIVADPAQRVQVQFWGEPSRPSIELIQPLSGDSPARRALEKGGGYNHLCFEVDDIEGAVEEGLAKGALCVCRPVTAAAFEGRRIAFLFYREIGLIEFVEAPKP